MKKTLLVLIVITIFSLSGCTDLPQDNFTNETRDHLDEAMDVFEPYKDHLQQYYENTYPDFGLMHDISEAESYIYVEPYKDRYFRQELLNYHINDDRYFMSENVVQVALAQVDRIYNFGVTMCKNPKEGAYCTNNEVNGISLMFQKEGVKVYIEYTVTTGSTVQQYRYLFDGLDESIFIDFHYRVTNSETNAIIKDANMVYKEDDLEMTVYNDYSGLHGTDYFEKMTIFDFTTKDYIKKYNTSEFTKLWFYNEDNEELYYGKQVNDVLEDFQYSVFSGTKLALRYNYTGHQYYVNLSEISGWDRLDKVMGSTYKPYYNGLPLEEIEARIEFRYGEYVYVEFSAEEPFEEEVLNLSKFGLSLPYDSTFFQDKYEYYSDNFNQIILENNLVKGVATTD